MFIGPFPLPDVHGTLASSSMELTLTTLMLGWLGPGFSSASSLSSSASFSVQSKCYKLKVNNLQIIKGHVPHYLIHHYLFECAFAFLQP